MSLSPLEYLHHILDETEYLLSESRDLSKEQFLQDATIKRAFVRSIEIIGEASKKVPPEIRDRFYEMYLIYIKNLSEPCDSVRNNIFFRFQFSVISYQQ